MRNCSTKADTSQKAIENTACSITDLWPERKTFLINSEFYGLFFAFSKISFAFPIVVDIFAALAHSTSLFIFQLIIFATDLCAIFIISYFIFVRSPSIRKFFEENRLFLKLYCVSFINNM